VYVVGGVVDRAALVREHGPGLYTLCRRLCADPEDAYQAVWAKVFAALPRFDPAGSAGVRTWIFTIAHRHLVDRHRRRSVRRRHVVDEPNAEVAVPPLAERAADLRQQRARLTAAIDGLPEPQRRVIVLHHLGGQSLDDIAATERVALGTVKSRLHRARARLAEVLRDLEPERTRLRLLSGSSSPAGEGDSGTSTPRAADVSGENP